MISHAAKLREKKLAIETENKAAAAKAAEAKRKADEEKIARRKAAELKSAQVNATAELPGSNTNQRPLSPARQKFLQASAAVDAGKTTTGKQQTGDQYELMSAALWEARRTLKTIKSIEGKIAKKTDLLPQFEPYIQGVLEAGNGAQDDVLMTCMVWKLDTGDISGALKIASYALKHNLKTPDHYERDTPTLLVEQVAEEALKQLDQEGINPEGITEALTLTDALTVDNDMHDQVRAKLYKALGYAWRLQGELETAHACLQRALELNDRVGVKKDIEKLERDIKNTEAQQQS